MDAGLLIAAVGVALAALAVLSSRILSLKPTAAPEEPEHNEVEQTREAIVWMTLICGSALTLIGLFLHFWG